MKAQSYGRKRGLAMGSGELEKFNAAVARVNQGSFVKNVSVGLLSGAAIAFVLILLGRRKSGSAYEVAE